MYINSPDLNQIDDDDLFTRPPRSARRMSVVKQARRTCRACSLTYVVALDYDGPPLCDECRADVKATCARIKRDLASIFAQMDAAIAAFDAVAAEHPTLWVKLQTALEMRDDGRMTEAQLAERWKARWYGPDDSWRVLLKAYENRECALAALGEERARLERALEACDG